MDRFDRELFLSEFHAHAVVAAGTFVGGPDILYEWASDMHEQGQSATQHCRLNRWRELDGELAHTETYYLFAARNRDATNWVAGGRYIDKLERRGGTWKIAMRCNAIAWSGLLPTMPTPFTDVPGVTLNGIAARSKQDISYRRPLANKRDRHVPGKP